MLKQLQDERTEEGRAVSLERHEAEAPRRTGRLVLVFKALLQTLLVAAILFGAYQGMRYFILTKPDVPQRERRETEYVVDMAPVQIADHAPVLNLYGEIVAARTVDLRALVAGEIVYNSENLKAGGFVAKGEELVRIDRFDYEGALVEAKANLAEARARQVENQGLIATERDNLERAQEQLEFARKDFDRAKQLLESGALTQRTVEERELLLSQRRQAVEQRRNAVAVAEAKVEQQAAALDRLEWRVREAERNLADTVLKAPFGGIVRTEAAGVGRLVGVNDVVATLYDRDDLEVRLTLSDNQYGRIVADAGTVIGRPVKVVWYIGREPVVYRATIDRVGADVALARGGVDAYAKVTMEDGKTPLRPGAFVEARLADQTYHDTARIPEAALYGADHVFVVVDGRTERRDVEVLAFDESHLIVKGDLRDGDVIVATRIAEAGEGLKVVDQNNAARGREDRRVGGETAARSPEQGEGAE
ncbi:HlyD family efflux transporter periplasmic adaptor subunit [Rhizobiales bacterium]|uniref:efflux RND transporter periplasmic adaptor subunit n=1 Tax=Hongsoonwoonella zoysiae TaxID=2821844 RepID=UPI001560F3F3|nr:HlyD family efflux transporter periplasmic adaptor subunit [Hongsoonwoonella zoysiae]NRG19653.1 HlyD family efflux transporter periplasmic adaptor subunit [Hongsoonwoonella zoysiae]